MVTAPTQPEWISYCNNFVAPFFWVVILFKSTDFFSLSWIKYITTIQLRRLCSPVVKKLEK